MFKISGVGTVVLLISIATAYTLMTPGDQTVENAGLVARVVGGGIAVSLLFELRLGYKNLLRADILAIISIYFLTLFEFLFDQEELNRKISPDQAYGGLELILIGIGCLVVSRHLYFQRQARPLIEKKPSKTKVKLLLSLFYISFVLGYFYILMKVDFNPLVMLEKAMGPRFSQPWSRGRFGGSFVYLSELQLFIYAIPPLAGILINYRKKLSSMSLAIVTTLLFITLFMGFVGGTRNVFFSYLVGFFGGYIMSLENLKWQRLIIPGVIALTLAYLASNYMVQFRSIGFTRFMNGQKDPGVKEDQVYVDHNLYTIGLLRQSFPGRYEYLGMEVFVWALVKPIPRALWSGKPEGLSVSLEQTAGVGSGYTLASTYIGESYMAGGISAVVIVSLLFGYLSAWWNNRASGGLRDEKLLVYALGLFVVIITMRSLFMFTTAILPIIGVNVLLRYLRK